MEVRIVQDPTGGIQSSLVCIHKNYSVTNVIKIPVFQFRIFLRKKMLVLLLHRSDPPLSRGNGHLKPRAHPGYTGLFYGDTGDGKNVPDQKQAKT